MTETVNVPLLRKAVEWVEWQVTLPQEDREWEQGAWCGTSMCVAGFVAVTQGWNPINGYQLERDGITGGTREVAMAALGLSGVQAGRLFMDTIDDTPEAEAINVRRIAEELAGEPL